MAEGRHFGAQGPKNRHLHAGVGDMVVAANDMRDAHVDVIDHGRQRIEVGPVLTHQDGVRERSKIDRFLAANQVVPVDFGAFRLLRVVLEIGKQKAPVRPAAVGLIFRDLRGRQRQRFAAIDRRQTAGASHLSAQVEFFRRFVAGIKKARRLQFLDGRIIDLEAFRLVFGRVLENAQPVEIVKDRIRIFLSGTGYVGIVKTLDEAPLVLLREKPVEKCGARIADMDAAGGRRSETDGDVHGRGLKDGTAFCNRIVHGRSARLACAPHE